nr:MAG TPA: hypothetical protein [Caudoviricetes sp.]
MDLNYRINEIIKAIESGDHLINRLHSEDIKLSLTCNLSDLRTYAYARDHFPKFYTRIMEEYAVLLEQLNRPDTQRYHKLAQRSLDLIKLSGVSFLSRLNTEKENRNE